MGRAAACRTVIEPPDYHPLATVLLILSGPAGSGKTTLCDALTQEFAQLARVVTTTTRPPRAGEVEGRDYYFLARAAFEALRTEGGFFEWAEIHGNLYGTQKRHVLELLRQNRDGLLNIDVQGAASFRRAADEDPYLAERLVTVFIRPRSLEQLRERMVARGKDSPEVIERRLRTAAEELEHAGAFDHTLLTDTREADYAAIRNIYLSAKGIGA